LIGVFLGAENRSCPPDGVRGSSARWGCRGGEVRADCGGLLDLSIVERPKFGAGSASSSISSSQRRQMRWGLSRSLDGLMGPVNVI
jgi:hypothetical protein